MAPRRILGISTAHDASVCLLADGRIELFIKEERLSHVKRDKLPFKAILAAVEAARGDIDTVCISTPTIRQDGDPIRLFVDKMIGRRVVCYGSRHHLSHASLAYYNSGFAGPTLVVVIDRNGSLVGSRREAETVFVADYASGFREIYKNWWDRPNGDFGQNFMSIVKVYESATTLIGQHPLENGKTMGLAAYGQDTLFPRFFDDDPIEWTDGEISLGRVRSDLFEEVWFSRTQPAVMFRAHYGTDPDGINMRVETVDEANYKMYADYAWQVQQQTQDQALKLIRAAVERTGIRQVCVTGGYAMNVVANAHYIRNMPDANFYFEPMADDTGNSIGAAMHLWRTESTDREIRPLCTTFFHGTSQDAVSVRREVEAADTGPDAHLVGADVDVIATHLCMQKTVAVFYGQAESGQRALGHRSILFDPRNPAAKEIVNRVKHREWYRPFAASVLEEDFASIFEAMDCHRSEFMTVSFTVRPGAGLPGVTHVDQSCRVQTVSQRKVPHLYGLLRAFKAATGCGVLLNTSFNLAGQPLVETVSEAIATFRNSEIDVLWFPEIGRALVKMAPATSHQLGSV